MPSERAEAFRNWEDTRIEMGLTREELARQAGVELKWLNDFIHVGLFADQVPRIKRVERILGIRLPHQYYECKKKADLRRKE
mgnify:CR=1 FL=1